MAPIDKLPAELLHRIIRLGSTIPFGQSLNTSPEQVRANYLLSCSLVNRAFALQARKLLFERPSFNSLESFTRFTTAARSAGLASEVRGCVIILQGPKKTLPKWKAALHAFAKEFTGVSWVEVQCDAAQTRLPIEEWFSILSERLVYLKLRHFTLPSPASSSRLSFPLLKHLDIEGCQLPDLCKPLNKGFFNLFPSLWILEWICCYGVEKSNPLKLSKSFPPLAPSLRSLTLHSSTSSQHNITALANIATAISSLSSLSFLDLSLDLIEGRPKLPPSIQHLVLSRIFAGEEVKSLPGLQASSTSLFPTPPLPSLKKVEVSELWPREARKTPEVAEALTTFRASCQERGIDLYVEDGGIDDGGDYAAYSKRLEIVPDPVEEGWDIKFDPGEDEKKEETLVRWRKAFQVTFLQGSVKEENLDICGQYLHWLQGVWIGDISLESKISWAIRKMFQLPEGSIPQWAEEKWGFTMLGKCWYRAVGGDLIKDDGAIEVVI